MQTILILQEKHGNLYFDVSTEQQLDNICRKILQSRLENDFYKPKDLPEKIITKEQLEKCLNDDFLPDTVKITLKQDYEYQQTCIKFHKIDQSFLEQVKECLKNPDKLYSPYINMRKVIWSFELLKKRNNCEYEGFIMEELSTSYEI